VARRRGLVISDEQMQMIDGVLTKLQHVTGSNFVALISTSGQPITVVPPDADSDTLSLAALAAGSFAATRQLAQVLKEREFTLLFHEGKESNLHVMQVTEQILMLLTFGRETQVGRVRLYTSRALEVLKPIFERAEDTEGDSRMMDPEYSLGVGSAIDDLFPEEDSPR
jgi:predicted regulator of Ras-like GTPase activity (Roadblock/LC7/MglB family)